MKQHDIRLLDIPISLDCNLSCDHCNVYSNLKVTSTRQNKQSLEKDLLNWKPFINPLKLQIIGGEPLLYKDLPSLIYTAREIFPKTDLRLFSNGLLLKKNLHLAQVLNDTNCMLVISIHSKDKRYEKLLKDNIKSFIGDYTRYNIKNPTVSFAKTFRKDKFTFELINMSSNWAKMYDDGIKPFNSDFKKAHSVCMWSHCTRLYKSKLWKCMPAAHLDDLLNTIYNPEDWDKYKNMYNPLSFDDSEDAKNKWFKIKDKPELICSMCREKDTDVIYDKKIW